MGTDGNYYTSMAYTCFEPSFLGKIRVCIVTGALEYYIIYQIEGAKWIGMYVHTVTGKGKTTQKNWIDGERELMTVDVIWYWSLMTNK